MHSGNSIIIAGDYVNHAITVLKKCSLSFTGSSSVYMNKEYNGSGADMIIFHIGGCSLSFNSSGWFYSSTQSVASATTYSWNLSVSKGRFVSRYDNRMFYANGSFITNVGVASTTLDSRTFYNYSSKSAYTEKTHNNCYYYSL